MEERMTTTDEQTIDSQLDKERERYINQLDRHLDWIKACDTKASIVLAVVGIFLTAITAEHSMKMFGEIAAAIITNINLSNILYIALMAWAFSVFTNGTYNLIRVLTPRLFKETSTNKEINTEDSFYYFESIAKKQFADYKLKVNGRSVTEEIDDILGQIYVNASIATEKYNHYRKGIKYSFIGIAAIVVLFIIGIILVKVGGM
jgi:hypothetical protein